MKIFHRLGWLACALTLFATQAPSIALADESPDVVANLGSNGVVFKLCDAFASTGICTSGGDEIVLDTGGYSSIAIDFSQSTTTFTCDIKGNQVGYDAENDAQTLNSTSFSGSQFAITLENTPRYVWITCSANGGGSVTATVLARRNK